MNSAKQTNPQSEFDSDVLPFSEAGTLESASQPFVGTWCHLVSRTNWEKGRIISLWRSGLPSANVAANELSDETWSNLVGGISAQHVGRLRRTFDRFGATWQSYTGLFWSHFYAALDWDDAEMWLEGAVQNNWSVSRMRTQRWSALGKPMGQRPQDIDIISEEVDAETDALAVVDRLQKDTGNSRLEGPTGPLYEGPDFGDSWVPSSTNSDSFTIADIAADRHNRTVEATADALNGQDLPKDLAGALESMKRAIHRHRDMQWREVELDRVLRMLKGLTALAGG